MKTIHRIAFALGSVALGVLTILASKPKDLNYRGQYKDRFVERPSVTETAGLRTLVTADADITQDDVAS